MAEPKWEYKRVSNPNSYDVREHSLPGHKFSYTKRRKFQSESRFSQFKANCSCRTKDFKEWLPSLEHALKSFNDHTTEVLKTVQQLPGLEGEALTRFKSARGIT